MESEGVASGQEQLEQVCGDIKRWRLTRAKAGAMPEPLWDAAALLAQALGVYRVARAAHLNYGALKERAACTARRQGRRARGTTLAKMARSDFVEMSGFPLLSGQKAGTVVEVVGADGARLTVRLQGTPDVPALVNAFRERR